MPDTTRYFGFILVILGIVSYIVSGAASITALIPAFFGIVFVILGRLAMKESIRKHIMHAAVLIALIGLIGSFPGLLALFGEIDEGMGVSVMGRSLMALYSILYLILAVKSFIDARMSAD